MVNINKGKTMNRKSQQNRVTRETNISVNLELDNASTPKIVTPIPFFTHMLENFSRHGGFFLECSVKGDIEVDPHHTVEDTGIVIGTAFREALGNKDGIARYGFMYLPMDDSLVRVVLDLSGRPFFKCNLNPCSGKGSSFDLEHCRHFFRSFSDHLQCNLHIELIYGEDRHHEIEAVFKGVAKALEQAVRITGKGIPTTKGTL